MEHPITCSRCLYWDLEHVQQSELDDDGIPIRGYLARCLNPDSPYHDRPTADRDVCGAFQRRGESWDKSA